VIMASDKDTLTLTGIASLAGLAGDFTFHS